MFYIRLGGEHYISITASALSSGLLREWGIELVGAGSASR